MGLLKRIILCVSIPCLLFASIGCNCTPQAEINDDLISGDVLTPGWFYKQSTSESRAKFYEYLKQSWEYHPYGFSGVSDVQLGGYSSASIVAEAETPDNQGGSGRIAHGILYVDPHVAYLAAFNLAVYHSMYILPKADYTVLSLPLRHQIATEIEQKTYDPKKYFEVSIGPSELQPEIVFERVRLEEINEKAIITWLHAGESSLMLYDEGMVYQCWSGTKSKK